MTDKAAEERGVNREKIKRIVILLVTALVAGGVGRATVTAPVVPADYAALDKRLTVLEASMDGVLKLEHKPLKVLVIYPDVKK